MYLHYQHNKIHIQQLYKEIDSKDSLIRNLQNQLSDALAQIHSLTDQHSTIQQLNDEKAALMHSLHQLKDQFDQAVEDNRFSQK